ncbi:MAG: class I SAM-dependent methyltransferase [Bacteroidales bacterium]
MSLPQEYSQQDTWRDWDSYIDQLPIKSHETILDLGCSIGTVSRLLAKKASLVIGIDKNSELLQEAIHSNTAENISYINGDLNSIKELELPLADGIWSSFTAAYFPNFEPILKSWLNKLKPDGWIAIVEMSDLFAHFPLSIETQVTFKKYYERQRRINTYDFEMGAKLNDFVKTCGLKIVFEENKYDRELTFDGPVEPQILKAWEKRFDRMVVFKEYLGQDQFSKIKKELLDCLSNKKHTSKSIVKFIVAKK